MPTYSNPLYGTSPIAAAVANFGKAVMSGGSEAERIKRAEEALKLKREREALGSVADIFAQFGQPGFDRNAAMSSAVLAGYDPSDLSAMERYGAANTFGAADQRTTNAFVGAGGAYGSTAHGFREGEANENARNAARIAESARQFDMTPYEFVGANGEPVVGTRNSALGNRPLMSETEAKGYRYDQNFGALGDLPETERRSLAGNVTSPTPRNYRAPTGETFITYDGTTDARTGAQLPPGGFIGNAQGSADDLGLTTKVRGDLQSSNIANQKFRAALARTRDLVGADPTNIGATGRVKGVVQDVNALAGNLAVGLGYDGLASAAADLRQKAMANGVNPTILSGVFDPNLPALHTAYDLLVYQAAEALAGQSGRSVTDKDVAIFKQVAGDPNALFSSQQSLMAKLDMMEQMLNDNQRVVDRALGRQSAPEAAPTAGAASAGPPTGAVDWRNYFGGP